MSEEVRISHQGVTVEVTVELQLKSRRVHGCVEIDEEDSRTPKK